MNRIDVLRSNSKLGAGKKRAGRCNSEFLGVKPRTEARRNTSAREYISQNCSALGPGKMDLLHEGESVAWDQVTLLEEMMMEAVMWSRGDL